MLEMLRAIPTALYALALGNIIATYVVTRSIENHEIAYILILVILAGAISHIESLHKHSALAKRVYELEQIQEEEG